MIASQGRISYCLHERKNVRPFKRLKNLKDIVFNESTRLEQDNGGFKTCSGVRRLYARYASPIMVPKYKIYGNTSCRKDNSIHIFFPVNNNLTLQNIICLGCAMALFLSLNSIKLLRGLATNRVFKKIQQNTIQHIKTNTSD